MLDFDFLLKHNELCLVGRGQVLHHGLGEAGLYARDTRFLSACSVTLDDEPLELLDLQTPAPNIALIAIANLPANQDGAGRWSRSMLIQQEIVLATDLVMTLTIRSYHTETVTTRLDVRLAADFRDMFDLRGFASGTRPAVQPAVVRDHGVLVSARTVDDRIVATQVSSNIAVEVIPDPPNDATSGACLRYRLHLPPGAETTIVLRISPEPVDASLQNPSKTGLERLFSPHLMVSSSSPAFDACVRRADADLALLQNSFPDGTIPAAGIPRFIAPFGRDSLIVGLQTMHAYPIRVAETLRMLARLQGSKVDPWREEAPGKILHEMRYGELARTGQIPHAPYYGSVDATPLFVMVFAQHYLWHRDDALYEELIGNVRRALIWIEQWGDLDGDGLVEFPGVQKGAAHIAQQGWKDSGDSLHYADGREVEGPIALVEVQGYVYAAWRWLSEAARIRGDLVWADELAAKADRVRAEVESRFWMEDAGFYAQALDGNKQPVDAMSSNVGHLLFCELPSAERAARVAERLAAPDLHTSWGIRTLSSEMATYNPVSYHNGSIWPHDMSLVMAGLRAYGHDDFARQLGIELLRLAAASPTYRLAEVYCGFSEAEIRANTGISTVRPIGYPVSCSPQAWAAGAALLALRVLLGLQPDPEHRRFLVDPRLPDDWERISVAGLKSAGTFVNISIVQQGADYAVTVDHGSEYTVAMLDTAFPPR